MLGGDLILLHQLCRMAQKPDACATGRNRSTCGWGFYWLIRFVMDWMHFHRYRFNVSEGPFDVSEILEARNHIFGVFLRVFLQRKFSRSIYLRSS